MMGLWHIFAGVLVIISITIGLLFWYSRQIMRHTLSIAEVIPDGLLIVDHKGRVVACNTNATKLFGYTKEEMINLTVEDLMPPMHRSKHRNMRTEFRKDPKIRPMGMGRDLAILKKDGTVSEAEIALSPAVTKCFYPMNFDSNFKIIVLLHDITDRKKTERDMRHLAYYDPLINIKNRIAFYEDSIEIIERVISAKRNLAFIILDIRELKKTNDTLGHYVGDDILKRTSSILASIVKDYRCNVEGCKYCDQFLYKIGGDEFLLLLEYDDDDTLCVDKVAQEILDKFKEPFSMEGTPLDMYIDVNMGISILPIHGMSISQLLKTADIALIKSKKIGKNIYTYYNKAINTEFETFTYCEHAIKHFIQSNEFDLNFQPVWSIRENRHVGAEVLFRGNRKIYPNLDVEFLINVAESTGLIIKLGRSILHKMCDETSGHGIKAIEDFIISVNISVQQLENKDFYDDFVLCAEKEEIHPNNIAIEITESVLMTQEATVINNLTKLREIGFRIYIDDFGKGFSSMIYLKDIPADKLKIDMAFLKDIETSEASRDIMSGIITLGHSLGMIVCCEGVENQKQMDILTDLDCDEIQGYFTGKPDTAEQLALTHEQGYPDCCK